MLGVIRVLTTTDDELLNRHGRILEACYGYECVSACIPDQPDGVHDEASEAAAVPKVAAL